MLLLLDDVPNGLLLRLLLRLLVRLIIRTLVVNVRLPSWPFSIMWRLTTLDSVVSMVLLISARVLLLLLLLLDDVPNGLLRRLLVRLCERLML